MNRTKPLSQFSDDMDAFLKRVTAESKKLKTKGNAIERQFKTVKFTNQMSEMNKLIKEMRKEIKKTEKKRKKEQKVYEKIKKDLSVITPGTYAITFTAVYKIKIWDWKKKREVWVTREKLLPDGKDAQVKIAKKIALYAYCEAKANEYLDDDIQFSEWELIKVKDIMATKIERFTLARKKVFGTKLAYKFLGDVQKINKNPGQCVLDFILYECQGKLGLAKVTRESLVKFFGKDCQTEGVNTDQVIEWAKSIGYVNVYALDPYMQTFKTYHTEADHHSLALCFIINNDHAYPIIDPNMKASIASKGRIDMKDFMYDVKYDNYYYISSTSPKFILDKIRGGGVQDKVILVELDNLCLLANNFIKETGLMIWGTNWIGCRLVSFQNPETGQIILSATEHDVRKAVCQDMFQEINCENFKFKNQTWTELGKSYFQARYGELKPSTYGGDLMDLYGKYKIAPYTAVINKRYNENILRTFDLRRDYTGILMNNDVDYNVFSAFDYLVPFDGSLTPGEYILDRTPEMADGTIKVTCPLLPYVLVKYLLEIRSISMADIKYVIRPTEILPANHFQEFASHVYDTWTETGSKKLINCFIGDLNKQTQKKTKACATDSYDIAMGILLNQEEKGEPARLHTVGDLYFLRCDLKKKLSSGHVPIWRHVIASSYIQLDKLYRKVVGENSRIIAYKVDSIKLEYPEVLELAENPRPGDIREEETRKISGRHIQDLEIPEPFQFQERTIQEIQDDGKIHEFLRVNSCMLNGMPGSNKTGQLSKVFDEKSIGFCFTNGAVEELKARGVKNVQTFDSFFLEIKRNTYMKTIKKYSRILVDEFSMVPKKFYIILDRIKRENPEMKFILSGDCNQCKPVETDGIWYDYMTNPLILNLVDYKRVTMAYKPELARYDRTLYDVLIYFMRHGRLPEFLEGRDCLERSDTNISYYNTGGRKTAQKKNQSCFLEFVEENESEITQVNGKPITVGIPIIGIENDKVLGIFRSQKYKVQEVKDDVIVLRKNNNGVVKEIKREGFWKYFDYGFCVTVYKYQGGTIREDYNIFDVDQMSYNEMYTAMSRGISLDKVHFKYTGRQFMRDTPPGLLLSFKPKPENKYLRGKIYLITDEDETFVYVGSTTQEIDARFQEQKQNPANPELRKLINRPGVFIQLLAEAPCLSNEDLLRIEDTWIDQHRAMGYNVVNKKCNIKKPEVKDPEIKIIQEKIITKYKIEDVERQQLFRIRWTEEKSKEKKFRYKRCSKEEAYAKAEEFRDEMIKRLH